MLKSEEYKKDSSTTIKVLYNLNSDKKKVDSTEVYENGTLKAKTEYTYYSHGGVKQRIEHAGQRKGSIEYKKVVTDYEYGSNGSDLTKVTTGGISQEYGYDSLGRIDWEKDGKGQKTDYTLDAFGNVTQIKYCDGTIKKMSTIIIKTML